MKSHYKKLLTITLVALAAVAAPAQNTTITYQGHVQDNGINYTGAGTFQFALVTTNATATNTLWSNDGTTGMGAIPSALLSLGVTNGLFTVLLGSPSLPGMAPLPDLVFTETNVQLEVWFSDGVNGLTLFPLQTLTPVPYAVVATLAAGVANGGVSGTSIASGQVVKWLNGLTDYVTLAAGTNITITTNGNSLTISSTGAAGGPAATNNVWGLNGNPGTSPANGNFLGTTDEQPLELRAGNQRALRLEPDTSGNFAPNVIGGSPGNSVTPGVTGATIGGGGTPYYGNSVAGNFGTVGGGLSNFAANSDTVGGGEDNTATFLYTTVGGGVQNNASGYTATVGGGQFNNAFGQGAFVGGGGNDGSIVAGNLATGAASVIGGGIANMASGKEATVTGGISNSASGPGAFVGGGGYDGTNIVGNAASGQAATVSGGLANLANAPYATVVGGVSNNASGPGAFVGGGGHDGFAYNGNTAAGGASTVAGGLNNSTTASYATVGGGDYNSAEANGSTVGGGLGNFAGGESASVPGGANNKAFGTSSFAAGQYAEALHKGAFVWADASQNASFASTGTNQFCIRAQGGVQLDPTTSLVFGSTPREMLQLYRDPSATYVYGIGVQTATLYMRTATNGGFAWYEGGTYNGIQYNAGGGKTLMALSTSGLTVNGTFISSSDRNTKLNFAPVDCQTVLEKVAQLPEQTWSYKSDPATKHLGPMAQDFYAAFGTGADNRHIAVVDEGGVALAAIQGLNQKLQAELGREDLVNAKLKQQNDSLVQRLSQLEAMVKQLAATK